MEQHRVTHLQCVPSMASMLVGDDSTRAHLEKLELLLVGGEALPKDLGHVLAETVSGTVQNMYGPTETTIWSLTEPVGTAGDIRIGTPLINTSLLVVDRWDQPVGIGVPGELLIGGAGVARGYHERPELNAERFVSVSLGGRPHERMYRTGDLVSWDRDGRLRFIGRLDDQVKIRGHRIELGEIETALTGHPSVSQAVVVARTGEGGEAKLVAYFIPTHKTGTHDPDLRDWLGRTLPDYMVPGLFVELDEFPLTPNQKVDRKKLPEPTIARAAGGTEYVEPSTPTEELLCTIWSESLGLEQVGTADNFFELGGDSLSAMITVSSSTSAGLKYRLRDLFRYPTVGQLAELVAAADDPDTATATDTPGREPHQPLPLSEDQEAVFFLDQLQGGSPAEHVWGVFEIQGALDTAALRAGVDTICHRHEILRTTFTATSDGPRQLVHQDIRAPFTVVDLRDFEGDQHVESQRILLETLQEPFEFQRQPPIRNLLVRLGDDRWIYLVMSHHIAVDHHSLTLFLDELNALYSEATGHGPANLPAVQMQYRDLERSLAPSDADAAEQLAHWREVLSDAETVLALPTDHPRPPLQTWRGKRATFEVSEDSTNALRSLARSENATLFMALAAWLQFLLHRYTAQSDIVLGTSVSSRRTAEARHVIGHLLKTVVLRGRPDAAESFRDLLRATRETALDAYGNADVHFDQLVRSLHPHRDASRNPVFQVMLQVLEQQNLDLPGLSVERFEMDPQACQFDLSFHFYEVGGSLSCDIDYDDSLFDESRIERLASHLLTSLDRIVAEPDADLNQLPILDGEEERQLLGLWNSTDTALSPTTFTELFEAQVDRNPDAVALEYDGLHLTYRQLDDRSNQLAHHLHASGVKPRDLVGLSLGRSLDLIVALLAILKAGAAYVPMDPGYPKERLRYMISDSGAKVVIATSSTASGLDDLDIPIARIDRDSNEIAERSPNRLTAKPSPDDLAYVIYTSGSTGLPKGVMVHHDAVTNFAASMAATPGIGADDRLAAVTTVSFDIHVLELLVPLIEGATVVLVPDDVSADGPALAQLLEKCGVTLMQATPTTWRLLLDAGWQPRPGFRALCGGEKLPPELASALAPVVQELWNMYGPTETTVWSSCDLVTTGHDISIGRPIANTTLHVLDKNLQLCPVGIPGELHIGGRGVTQGYLGRPDLTAERFIPDPYSDDGRLYKTGDLVRRGEDGRISFLRRLDDQVKVRGYRIELAEIEATLSRLANIDQAAVVVRPTSAGENRLVAYVQSSVERSTTALRQALAETLPGYMLPAVFVHVDEMPLTPNGKIDKKSLPEPELTRPVLDSDFAEAESSVHLLLTEIWTTVLEVDGLGIHDNFFELGGDSLLAIRVVSMAQRAGLALSPRHLFFHQTIAELGTALESKSSSELGSRERAIGSGPAALTPGQRRYLTERGSVGLDQWNYSHLYAVSADVQRAEVALACRRLVGRHEALRARFHRSDRGWSQTIDDRPHPATYQFRDLSSLSASEQWLELDRLVQKAQESLDLEYGPVFQATHFALGAGQPDRLLLTVHHLVTDNLSWEICLEDLESYLTGAELQPIPTSYSEWTKSLARMSQTRQIRATAQSWLALPWHRVQTLPLDFGASRSANTNDSVLVEELQLPTDVAHALEAAGRVDEILLAGLVHALHGLTSQPVQLVDVMKHGRDPLAIEDDLSRTVGFLVSYSPYVLKVESPADPSDLMNQTLRQIRDIKALGDLNFDLLRFSGDQAFVGEFAELPSADVLFNYRGRSAPAPLATPRILQTVDDLAIQTHSSNGLRRYALAVSADMEESEILVKFVYSRNLHSPATIRRLAGAVGTALAVFAR
ncbi:MAG: amino acid adenylation domain-containing protein [Acidimicrobiales bacterium]|nr:amino acid adenylation domain-containing protein [Acidimicrobiales bacterium]